MRFAFCCRRHHREAAESFQHAAVAAPEDARPLFRLGNALFATQQFHDSQVAFSQALSSASLPDDAALLPKIHVNLGISLEAGGQLELACQHYRCRVRPALLQFLMFTVCLQQCLMEFTSFACLDHLQVSQVSLKHPVSRMCLKRVCNVIVCHIDTRKETVHNTMFMKRWDAETCN